MSDWKPISGGREMREHPAGFAVIRPIGAPEPIPFECMHCGMLMRDQSDPETYTKKGCCSRCSTMWAEGLNAARWEEGWRPERDEVERCVEMWKRR